MPKFKLDKQRMAVYLAKPLAWSYSRVSLFEECPAKYAYKNIYKVPEVKSPAMGRGLDLHDIGERYMRGKIKKLPPEFHHFKKDMDDLRKVGAVPEQPMVFTADWGLPMVDWFSPMAWLRMKMDIRAKPSPTMRVVVDYKTGKVYEKKHQDQGSLYALAEFKLDPKLKKVQVEMWYLDSESHGIYEFKRSMVEGHQKNWERRVHLLGIEKQFKPTPYFGCAWCPFRKKKGGPCEY